MHVHKVFEQVGAMTCDEGQKSKNKKEGDNDCRMFVTKFNLPSS